MRNILLAFALLVFSCQAEVRDPEHTIGLSFSTSNWVGTQEKDLSVVNVDGCEYLIYAVGTNVIIFTHKGNCKNEFHKHETRIPNQ